MAFIEAGEKYHVRAIVAANRVGKSLLGGYEMATHLCGWYPEWWKGKRFLKPISAWAGGDTSQTVRDIAQEILLGPPGAWGTGLIPGECIVDINKKAGSVPDAVESVIVRHKSGLGNSRLGFKSYDQKRKSFQGTAKDIIWLDEECPMDIWGECEMRTMTTQGHILLTFTPLMGLTPVVLMFMPGGKEPKEMETNFVIRADWNDAPHLTEEDKARQLANMEPHLKKARSQGVPHLGAGAIYPIAEEKIIVDPFEIPIYWPRAYALDVGWDRTAALWGAKDRNSDITYLYSEHYMAHEKPPIHAEAIKGRGDWIPGVIDPAARGRSQKDGERLVDDYINLGLNLSLAENAVEAGIYRVWTGLSTGKLKVFSTLQNWLDEFRIYRRDEKGKIVKANDHLMDDTRYLYGSGMEIAHNKPVDLESDEYRRHEEYNYDRGRSKVGGY